jgi:multiple sugar transport system ATP-binding protein
MGDRVAVMRDGRLEQCDTPAALYARPANLFVAAFIGSPAMNLLRARIDDGRLCIGPHRLPLPPGKQLSGEVVVGIRPEALDETRGTGQVAELELRVALVEALGPDLLVHLELDADEVVAPHVEIEREAAGVTAVAEREKTLLVARLPPHTPAVAGRVLRVRIDLGALHFFDPETELAIR